MTTERDELARLAADGNEREKALEARLDQAERERDEAAKDRQSLIAAMVARLYPKLGPNASEMLAYAAIVCDREVDLREAAEVRVQALTEALSTVMDDAWVVAETTGLALARSVAMRVAALAAGDTKEGT